MNPESGDKAGQKQKVRFAPKPPKKLLKPVVPKVSKVEAAVSDDARAQELLRSFNESRAKTEKKETNVQVAFGYGGTSTSFRSSGCSKKGSSSSSNLNTKKEYQDPWDFNSNYPVSLPLRIPYSGNPERLNEEEFWEASKTTQINENTPSKPAKDLGLMEVNPKTRLLFLQLPNIIPTLNNSQSSAASSSSSKAVLSSEKICKLNELPAGYMGKLLVYESGVVKLKLGETIFDVYEGLNNSFAQEAVAINTKTAQICSLGELNKTAIVVPDVEYILNSIVQSDFLSRNIFPLI